MRALGAIWVQVIEDATKNRSYYNKSVIEGKLKSREVYIFRPLLNDNEVCM